MLPQIDKIDPQRREFLLSQIDAIVRKSEDIELALDIVDKEILINMLGIDPEWCASFRKIWKS